MSRPPADDGIARFTRNDPVAAAELRRAFRTIAEGHSDPGVARVAREVLDGRRTIREAARSPELQRAMAEGITTFRRRWDELSDDARRALVERGAAARDELAGHLEATARPDPVLEPGSARAEIEEFLLRRDPASGGPTGQDA